LEALAHQAGVTLHSVGGLRLIRADEVPALLKVLRRNRVPVLGAEGFRLEGSGPVPDNGAILNLEDAQDVEGSIDETMGFIAEVATHDLFFDLVLGDARR